MKLQISLSGKASWIRPSEADMKLEFKYEYSLPSRNWPARCRTIGAKYPIFADEADFIAKVKSSPIVKLTANMQVHNMTNYSSIEDIEDLVSGYAFPRDVKRIVSGFTSGVAMPLPIIIKGRKSLWILSGNTRQNVALVLGIPRQAIVVDAS